MHLVLCLILFVVILILVFLVRLADNLKEISNELLPDIRSAILDLPRQPSRHRRGPDDTHSHGILQTKAGCLIVWEWTDGEWQVHTVPEGIVPGLPPNFPGAFNGDIAKTWVSS